MNNNEITNLTDEQAERLMNVIFKDDEKVADAQRKAGEWLSAHDKMVSVKDIINSVEVAEMTLAEDFEKWDEMKDDEKNDLAEMMCGLMVARDLIADMFGMKTRGRVERVEEEDE